MRKIPINLFPLVIYPVFIMIINVRTPSINSNYLVSIIPVFAVISTFVLNELVERIKKFKYILILIGIFVFLQSSISPGFPNKEGDNVLSELVQHIRDEKIGKDKITVSHILYPTFKYYFRQAKINRIYNIQDAIRTLEMLTSVDTEYFIYWDYLSACISPIIQRSIDDKFVKIKEWQFKGDLGNEICIIYQKGIK